MSDVLRIWRVAHSGNGELVLRVGKSPDNVVHVVVPEDAFRAINKVALTREAQLVQSSYDAYNAALRTQDDEVKRFKAQVTALETQRDRAARKGDAALHEFISQKLEGIIARECAAGRRVPLVDADSNKLRWQDLL